MFVQISVPEVIVLPVASSLSLLFGSNRPRRTAQDSFSLASVVSWIPKPHEQVNRRKAAEHILAVAFLPPNGTYHLPTSSLFHEFISLLDVPCM